MTVAVIKYDEDKTLDDVPAIRAKLEMLIKEIGYVVPSNKKIFIKPNLCGRDPKLKAENTTGPFLEAVLSIFAEKENEIFVGHTSLLGTVEIEYPFERLAAAQNYPEVVAKFKKAKLVNLDNLEQKKVKCDMIEFEIPKMLDEMDQYISLTKLKTHSQTTVSLSLKNQMGTVSMENRKFMHSLGVHHYISELATVIKPNLNIIDGILAMEGQGPHHGEDVRFNAILGGTDQVELDSLACTLMGIDYHVVGYITESYEKGIGKYVSPEISKKYSTLIRNFKMAKPVTEKIKNLRIWPTTACTGCTAALVEIGLKIDNAQGTSQFQIPEMDFFLGTGEGLNLENMGKTYGLGDCAKVFCAEHQLECLPGCPMSIKKVQDFVFNKMVEETTTQTRLMFKQLKMIMEGRLMGSEVITQGYDRIGEVYENLWGEYTKSFNQQILDQLDIKEGMSVLDLACGTGANTIQLAEKSKTGTVIGIDLSKGMLEQARKNAEAKGLKNIKFIEGDMLKAIQKPNYENVKFDRIVTFWALGYSDPVKILKEIKRLLKDGGKIGIITNMGDSPKNAYKSFVEIAGENTDAIAVRVDHKFPVTMEQFQSYFADAGFEIEKIHFNEGKFEKIVPDGKAALDWMIRTGAGALYDDAIKPEWKERVHKIFTQRMNRYKYGNGITITHEFFSALI